MHATTQPAVNTAELLELKVNEVAERFPSTMPVLSELGLDLCCGGGHQLKTALSLHGIDAEAATAQLLAAIGQVTVSQ